ncbi:hypothetical protein [Amycolatopsis sp. H20-H5]|uniref:hypothetical protein n=1 Tax=Amycolatopsis sp. H20-H5 TaxID=3046309 RepID=UPI002DBC0AC6|nr:hypothetical protein [Amycolatopsis sp. H20-H5]MEC3975804.1 hypothetical protein [Amycolatopsis sp. H20-H5]
MSAVLTFSGIAVTIALTPSSQTSNASPDKPSQQVTVSLPLTSSGTAAPASQKAGPDFEVALEARANGQRFQPSVNVLPATGFQLRLLYKNSGDITENNVLMKLQLPEALTFLSGSTHLLNSNNPHGEPLSDGITGAGVNIGHYSPAANAIVIVSVVSLRNQDLACPLQFFTPTLSVETAYGTRSAGAEITLERSGC